MLSKSNICPKCKKVFSSSYNLEKHVNRKIPCTTVLKCEKCDKIFTKNQHLSQHLNRKTPCFKQTKLEEEKKILLFKHKLELEKLEKEKEIKLEIIKAQTEKSILIEKERNDRKNQTAKIINNNNQKITNDNRIQQINNFIINIPTEGIVDATPENFDMLTKFLVKEYRETYKTNMLLDKKESTLIHEILRGFFRNKYRPERRNLVYSNEVDSFYKLVEKKWGPIENQLTLQFLRQILEHFNEELTSEHVEFPSDKERKEEYMIKIKCLDIAPLHRRDDHDIIEAAKEILVLK